MRWSWKLFRVFGIDVHMHATFLLLLLYVALGKKSAGDAARAVLYILALFGCVLLHELGHALAARRFGVGTRDITLLPIGGVARLERIPTEPREEFVVAIAGPLVNVVIAGLLFAGGALFGWGSAAAVIEGESKLLSGSFLEQLAVTNAFLALFNCVPAFPMDGGRILRAILASRMDYLRATRTAVAVGQVLAFGMGLVGLLGGNIPLALVALFVFLGAAHEGAAVQLRHDFRGLPVSVAMLREFHTLKEDDRLETAVEQLLAGSQADFPVLRAGESGDAVVGILTRSALIEGLGAKGPLATIRSVTVRPVRALSADLPLDRAYELIQEEEVKCLPVLEEGRLVGLLTLENLVEFSMVTSAMRGLREKRGG